MSRVELFFEDAVSDLRRQLASASGTLRRAALEDQLTLLTDYRLAGIDESQFERLLSSLRTGRSPVSLRAVEPHDVARDLAHQWQTYRAEGAVHARN